MTRAILLSLALVVGASALHAQFSGLNKLKQKAKEVADKAQQVEQKGREIAQVAKPITGIGPEEERVIGGSVALEIVGSHGGLWRDEEATRRINLVGKSLARYSARPELEWRFGVLDSESINAFSAPAGYVFITRRLYELLKDDDALAAVLAHEIAHITERHALTIVARNESLGRLSAIAAQHSSDVREAEALAREFDLGVGQITRTLFEVGFDPRTEYEADRKGRELAVLTGYAPGAFRAVLLRLKAQSPGGNTTKIFSTHPPLDERLKRLPRDDR